MLDYKVFEKVSDVLINHKITATKSLKIAKDICALMEEELSKQPIPVIPVNRPNFNAAKGLKVSETMVGED